MNPIIARVLAAITLAVGIWTPAVQGDHPCTSPLILDLENDGVITTSVHHGVEFDINADGQAERVAWTAWYFREGFLWLDLNRNGRVDDGSELFGDSMMLPDGTLASNGFEALAVYDRRELGGDEDGVITSGDLVWNELRVWVDENQNGISERSEVRLLRHYDIVAIDLNYTEHEEIDGNMNLHKFQGTFLRWVRGEARPFLRGQPVHDVFFQVGDPDLSH